MSVLDEVIALARVQHGKLYIQGRKQFDALVKQLDPNWQLEVSIKRLRATRSTQANRYYWGVVLAALADYTGHTPEELHDIMKAKFLPKALAFSDHNGEVVEEFVLGGSTRKLNTKEFSDYVNQIRNWAASELDCYIPASDEA
jgi:hypothetical protein